jgi:tetrahydromethanopterin S-methyltransferase subunit B
MATQSRNLYDQKEIDAIRSEFGVTTVGEAMENVAEETKDMIVDTVTNVAEATTNVVSFIDRGGVYYIAGVVSGMVLMVIARLLN